MKKVFVLAAVLVLSSVSSFALITCSSSALDTVISNGGCVVTGVTENGGGNVNLVFGPTTADSYLNLNANGAAPAPSAIFVTASNVGTNGFNVTFAAAFTAVAAAGDASSINLKFLYSVQDQGANRFGSGNVTAGLNGLNSVDDPTEANNTNNAQMFKYVTNGTCAGGFCATEIIQAICPQASGNCGGPNFTDGPQNMNSSSGALGVSISNTFAFTPSAIPEPITFFSLGSGLLALGLFRRFRK